MIERPPELGSRGRFFVEKAVQPFVVFGIESESGFLFQKLFGGDDAGVEDEVGEGYLGGDSGLDENPLLACSGADGEPLGGGVFLFGCSHICF